MLVLSRKVDQVLVIDGRVRLTICEIAGGRVKVGVDAPRDVRIEREEVALRSRGNDADGERLAG